MQKIRSSIEVLTANEIRQIHEASARILEEVGIHVPDVIVLKRCEDFGATVNYQTETMQIPQNLLNDTLDKLKKENRNKFLQEKQENDIKAHISTQVFYTDYITATTRYGIRDDNLKGFALCEKLNNFPFADPIVVPSDVPERISDLIGFQDMYKYSTKPGATYILTPLSAKYILEMNRTMGKKSKYLLETISPLSFKKDSLEMARMFADNGCELNIGPMCMGGATAPVTVAGTIVLENAEILASLFIVYVLTNKVGGYSAPVHSMDMKTMLCSFGSANQALFAIAHTQLADYYGINAMTNAGLTDALMPDFQGGIEKGITACFNFLSGARSMGAMGIVGADQGISLEQLVLDNEWIEYYNYIIKGIEVSEETIGLDEILETGIGGNFLNSDHTFDYWKDSYLQSEIFTRNNFRNWINLEKRDILSRAHDFVEESTKDYQKREPVISASLCEELDRIVDEAIREIMNTEVGL